MAKYTIEINELLERGFKLRLDEYPLFDETYRPILNQKIVNHYYFREIGQETPERFNFILARRLDEIMPLYNQLYRSELLAFDPLATDYMTSTNEREQIANQLIRSKARRKLSENVGDTFTANSDKVTKRNLATEQDTNGSGNYDKKGNTADTGHEDNEFSKSGITASTGTDKTVYDKGGTNDKTIVDKTVNKKGGTNDKTIAETGTTKKTEVIDTNTSGEADSKTDTSNVSRGTAGTTKTGSKNTIFSDVPQSNLGALLNASSASAIALAAGDTYATTVTSESTRENSDTTTTENLDIDTTNHATNSSTGQSTTVTDGTSKTDKTDNDVWKEDGTTDVNKSDKDVWSEDGTSTLTTKLDGTSSDNGTGSKDTTASGTYAEDGNNSNTSHENATELEDFKDNTKDDTQRNTTRAQNTGDTKSDTLSRTDNIADKYTEKGRKGYSPSELLMLYRKTFLNIDMMIIDELQNLFMGVY